MTRLENLIEWMDELVLNESRDERILFSVWQNLKSEIKEKMRE